MVGGMEVGSLGGIVRQSVVREYQPELPQLPTDHDGKPSNTNESFVSLPPTATSSREDANSKP